MWQEKLKSVIQPDFENFGFVVETNNNSIKGISISFKVKIDVFDKEKV